MRQHKVLCHIQAVILIQLHRGGQETLHLRHDRIYHCGNFAYLGNERIFLMQSLIPPVFITVTLEFLWGLEVCGWSGVE